MHLAVSGEVVGNESENVRPVFCSSEIVNAAGTLFLLTSFFQNDLLPVLILAHNIVPKHSLDLSSVLCCL